MQRTLDNCDLIKRCVKAGMGEPKQYYFLNRCEGYTRSEYNNEPCEKCKKCKYNISFE